MNKVLLNMPVLKVKNLSTYNTYQGVDKLSDPFLDTLSRYQLGRNGDIEQTWDTVQKDVGYR